MFPADGLQMSITGAELLISVYRARGRSTHQQSLSLSHIGSPDLLVCTFLFTPQMSPSLVSKCAVPRALHIETSLGNFIYTLSRTLKVLFLCIPLLHLHDVHNEGV